MDVSVPPDAAFKLSPQAMSPGLSACCAGTQLESLRATGLSCTTTADESPMVKAQAMSARISGVAREFMFVSSLV